MERKISEMAVRNQQRTKLLEDKVTQMNTQLKMPITVSLTDDLALGGIQQSDMNYKASQLQDLDDDVFRE